MLRGHARKKMIVNLIGEWEQSTKNLKSWTLCKFIQKDNILGFDTATEPRYRAYQMVQITQRVKIRSRRYWMKEVRLQT